MYMVPTQKAYVHKIHSTKINVKFSLEMKTVAYKMLIPNFKPLFCYSSFNLKNKLHAHYFKTGKQLESMIIS
jgi:hypothetical protein